MKRPAQVRDGPLDWCSIENSHINPTANRVPWQAKTEWLASLDCLTVSRQIPCKRGVVGLGDETFLESPLAWVETSR